MKYYFSSLFIKRSGKFIFIPPSRDFAFTGSFPSWLCMNKFQTVKRTSPPYSLSSWTEPSAGFRSEVGAGERERKSVPLPMPTLLRHTTISFWREKCTHEFIMFIAGLEIDRVSFRNKHLLFRQLYWFKSWKWGSIIVYGGKSTDAKDVNMEGASGRAWSERNDLLYWKTSGVVRRYYYKTVQTDRRRLKIQTERWHWDWCKTGSKHHFYIR